MTRTRAATRLLTLALLLAAPAGRGAGLALVQSYWNPADFSDDFAPAVRASVPLTYRWELEFRAARFPDMGDDVEKENGPVVVDLTVVPLELGLVAALPYQDQPLVQPYFGGGLGYYQIDLEAKGPAGRFDYRVDDELGVYLIAGLRLHVSYELVMLLEVTQRFVEGDASITEADGDRSSVGMNLNGLGANLGLGFHW